MGGLAAVAIASILTSTTAKAGLCEVAVNVVPVASQGLDHKSRTAPLQGTVDASPISSDDSFQLVNGVDPLAADPAVIEHSMMSTSAHVTDAAAPATVAWNFSDPTESTSSGLPESRLAPPLLIPLPTAVSAGAWGLLVVAILMGARRTLRRRLFA
jgi:hypothetical protein